MKKVWFLEKIRKLSLSKKSLKAIRLKVCFGTKMGKFPVSKSWFFEKVFLTSAPHTKIVVTPMILGEIFHRYVPTLIAKFAWK